MKKLLALLLSVALVLSLTACGQQQTQQSDPSLTPNTPATVPASTGDSFPSKPILCIVPFTAGGGTDVIARMMSSVFPTYCDGASMIVENQAGGASVPGTVAVKEADNDGHTIGYSFQAAWVLRQHILDTGYTMDDFTLICGVEMQHNGVYVNADSPFQTLQDLIDYGLAHPGELTYSTGPAASYQEIVANGLMMDTGMEAVNVPYEGARQAALGMMAGDLDFTILQATTYSAEQGAGTVRMLCSFENDTYEEGVPTIAELGYPDLTFSHRSVVYGPANMPEEAVAKIEAAFKGICEDEVFLQLATNSQADIQFCDHEQLLKETLEQDSAAQRIIDATMK